MPNQRPDQRRWMTALDIPDENRTAGVCGRDLVAIRAERHLPHGRLVPDTTINAGPASPVVLEESYYPALSASKQQFAVAAVRKRIDIPGVRKLDLLKQLAFMQ